MIEGTFSPSTQFPLGDDATELEFVKPKRPVPVGSMKRRSLTPIKMYFIDDHKLLTDEEMLWTAGGDRYASPEWAFGLDKGHPVSVTGGEKIRISLGIRLNAPKGSGGTKFSIKGEGLGLTFEARDVLIFPEHTAFVWMTSDNELPREIGSESLKIKWTIHGPEVNVPGLHNRIRARRFTTNNEILITAGLPQREVGEVTYKRLSTAVDVCAGSDPDDPVAIAKKLMKVYNKKFTLQSTHSDGWTTAEAIIDKGMGADCRSIASMVQEIFAILGLDGNAKAMLVYPKYQPPMNNTILSKNPVWGNFKAVAEAPPNAGNVGGLENPPIMYYDGDFADILDPKRKVDATKLWKATLWGTSDNTSPNNFEACLQIKAGADEVYFPGGASTDKQLGPHKKLQDILNHMFPAFGWFHMAKDIKGDLHKVRVTEVIKKFPA